MSLKTKLQLLLILLQKNKTRSSELTVHHIYSEKGKRRQVREVVCVHVCTGLQNPFKKKKNVTTI